MGRPVITKGAERMKQSGNPKLLVAAVLIACAWTAFHEPIFFGQGSSPPASNTVRKYADPIPNPLTSPDPCDNPTVKRWGPKDQRGNFNFVTPAKVLSALKLVKEGRLIRVDHLWE